MTPFYGRAAQGKRVVDHVPHGHCHVVLIGNDFSSIIAL